jgi:hypothetical protein
MTPSSKRSSAATKPTTISAALDDLLPLLSLVRLLSETCWFGQRGDPTAENLNRAITWHR